jgi:hypothetical protein
VLRRSRNCCAILRKVPVARHIIMALTTASMQCSSARLAQHRSFVPCTPQRRSVAAIRPGRSSRRVAEVRASSDNPARQVCGGWRFSVWALQRSCSATNAQLAGQSQLLSVSASSRCWLSSCCSSKGQDGKVLAGNTGTHYLSVCVSAPGDAGTTHQSSCNAAAAALLTLMSLLSSQHKDC